VACAVAVAPPRAGGSVAVIAANPLATAVTSKVAEVAPAAMVTDAGTVAAAVFDDARAIETADAGALLIVTVMVVGAPTATAATFGVSEIVGLTTIAVHVAHLPPSEPGAVAVILAVPAPTAVMSKVADV
jgi:hypothetical protein